MHTVKVGLYKTVKGQFSERLLKLADTLVSGRGDAEAMRDAVGFLGAHLIIGGISCSFARVVNGEPILDFFPAGRLLLARIWVHYYDHDDEKLLEALCDVHKVSCTPE